MKFSALILILGVLFMPKMGHAELRGISFTNWTFRCEDKVAAQAGNPRPHYNHYLRENAEIAAIQGLKKISAINPNLAKTVLQRWKAEPLFFACALSSESYPSGNANAYFDGRNPLDLRIHLLRPALQMQEDNLKATLLHELLHFAGLDNLSAVSHTYHPYNRGIWTPGVMDDVVFACTAEAFPTKRVLEVRSLESKTGTGILLSRSYSSCAVCANAAVVDRYSTKIIGNDAEEIQRRCELNGDEITIQNNIRVW